MALHNSFRLLASSPGVGIAPETTPIKYVPSMLNIQNSIWWNQRKSPYRATYREKTWLSRSNWSSFNKVGGNPVLRRKYSREALQMALELIPRDFQVADVPRPPQRVRAHSEGIVGRWYTNYWTLHSIKYQCLLASSPSSSSSASSSSSFVDDQNDDYNKDSRNMATDRVQTSSSHVHPLDWRWGERDQPKTNYEQPHMFVDFEETKALRDYRSRWININRSLVGMTRKMKDAEEEYRYMSYKKTQEQFWSNRKVFVNRVKSMTNQGSLTSSKDLPIKTFNVKSFLSE